jgi:predicted Zn finger-like uncharacterized protein
MPKRSKIKLDQVRAALSSACPECGHEIKPNELQRIDGQRVRCPKCSAIFVSGKTGN